MSIVLTIKVVPNAREQKIQLEPSGQLKLYIKSPPVDGKANEELIAFFSKVLKIPKKSLVILSGLTTRIKRIACETELTRQEIYQKLGGEGSIMVSSWPASK